MRAIVPHNGNLDHEGGIGPVLLELRLGGKLKNLMTISHTGVKVRHAAIEAHSQ